jgi:hypothetical protein
MSWQPLDVKLSASPAEWGEGATCAKHVYHRGSLRWRPSVGARSSLHDVRFEGLEEGDGDAWRTDRGAVRTGQPPLIDGTGSWWRVRLQSHGRDVTTNSSGQTGELSPAGIQSLERWRPAALHSQ